MNASNATTLAGLLLLATMVAQAQEPKNLASDPSAASSPHQRSATSRQTTETSTNDDSTPTAASSPHQQSAMGSDSKGKNMAADRDGADPAAFLKKAALGGMTEVALSKAAASKSKDAGIRKFADRMVQDHGKANDELSAIAKKKGMQVPTSLDAEHQAIVQKVSNKSGTDFDNAYSRQMAADHKKAVALFEGAAQSSDADLAAFAKKTLPTLEEHTQMADKLPGASHSADNADPASKM